jgi:putative endonuclease
MQAIAWEKQIKGWSRKKKEALFNEDWEEIKKLAKNYTDYPRSSSTDSE